MRAARRLLIATGQRDDGVRQMLSAIVGPERWREYSEVIFRRAPRREADARPKDRYQQAFAKAGLRVEERAAPFTVTWADIDEWIRIRWLSLIPAEQRERADAMLTELAKVGTLQSVTQHEPLILGRRDELRLAAFDEGGFNLVANPQKHMAESFAPMPTQTKYTDVKGYATYYYYSGATTLPDVVPDFSRGRKIVFVHGAGSNGHTWHRQIEAFGGKHSPIALDLPGHGRSAGVEGLRTVQRLRRFRRGVSRRAEDQVGGDLRAFDGRRDRDGPRARGIAARVEALILSCTAAKFNVTPDRIEGLRAITMGRAPQAFNTDGYSPKTVKENFDVVREGWMEQIKTDPRVRYTDILACAQVDLRDAIAKIDKPALVLAGADDKGTTPADAEFIAGKIRGATRKIIADAGHYIPRERPAEYNAAIEQFVDGSEVGIRDEFKPQDRSGRSV